MNRRSAPMMLLSLLALVACGDDEPSRREIEVRVRGGVGARSFVCGRSYSGIGASRSTWEGRDFRLYLSNVRLVDARGGSVPLELVQDGKWQHGTVVLLDFEDGEGACRMGNADLNGSIRGSVPAGDYAGIRFDLGVPFDVNHGDAAVAPAPLNVTTMWWNWNAGYKFLRVDGVTAGLPSWRLHLGSTGCDGDMMGNVNACAHPNRASVAISDFDPDTDVLVADLAELLGEADLENHKAGDPGCMSKPADTECAPYFSRLGLPFGTQAAGTQAFFRKE